MEEGSLIETPQASLPITVNDDMRTPTLAQASWEGFLRAAITTAVF